MPISAARKSLLGRADNILSRTSIAVAAGAGAGLLGMPQSAEAAIIYSGVVNIPIPNTFAGVYVNLVTQAFGANTTLGWDINPYGTGYLRWFTSTGGGIVAGAGNATLFDNLMPGTLVDATSVFDTGTSQTDPAAPLNPGSSNNYFGFRFVNEAMANQTQFAWVQLDLSADLNTKTIVAWAYEDTGAGINVAAVPEPTSLTLLSVGAAGLIARRRLRRKAAAEVVA